MSTFVQDLKFGARLLIKDRSFTITALLTLAVCIGANAAMFSILRSVVMKPLPFPGSDRVVLLYNSYPNAGAPRVGNAVPDYFDRITAVPALATQAVFRREGMTYGDEQGAERVIAIRATSSFFDVVAVSPRLGRTFTAEEAEPGQNQKAVLSYGFWQRKFGGREEVLGRSVRLNGTAHEVIGVMPPEFTFLQNDVDLFVPTAFTPDDKSDNRRHSNNWQMVGRLADGASLAQVEQQVSTLNRTNDDRFPQFRQILKDARFHTVSILLQEDLIRDVKQVLYLLWFSVLFVLLIGCVNIANLVMVRSSGRTREMATRHAIGGELGRLARQLLTESTLLAVAGGGLGLLLGWWATRSVSSLNIDQLPRGYEIGLDAVSVAMIVALTVVVGLAIGVAPVLRLRRMNLNVELREESRGGTAGRRANLARRVLAVVQVTIALMLLVVAGLLLASFRAVLHLDYGFDPSNVVTAGLTLPPSTYPNVPSFLGFEERMFTALRAIPGVTGVGGTTALPFSGAINNNVIVAEGYQMKPGESLVAPSSVIATAGYFETMRIPLVRGRTFEARDSAQAPQVAIVDERLAKKFWPDQDPIGRRLYRPSDPSDITKITPQTTFITVVGVVKEVQLANPRVDFTPVGMTYFPYDQAAQRSFTLTVRTAQSSPTILAEIRREITRIDPQIALFRVQPMQQWIDQALVGRRVPMMIAIAFGAVALFLSAIGIYGVLAYSVAQRQRELGVRMALGGSGASVFGLVLGDGLRIVGLGLAFGLVGSLGVAQVMKSQLFNVAAINPVVLIAVTATLSVVALFASGIPALRASRINPIVVLSK
jgi:predicted permease